MDARLSDQELYHLELKDSRSVLVLQVISDSFRDIELLQLGSLLPDLLTNNSPTKVHQRQWFS